MNDCINRKAFIGEIEKHYCAPCKGQGGDLGGDWCRSCVINSVLEKRREFPAADVVEVRHGRWRFGKDLPDSFGSINKNKYHLYCSECRNQAFNKTVDNDPDFDVDTPFCPWCGAKMDKEEACQNGGN